MINYFDEKCNCITLKGESLTMIYFISNYFIYLLFRMSFLF